MVLIIHAISIIYLKKENPMHTDIAYNSLPVSELLAEFDERWPLPLPDSDRVQ